jgi:hypothetical protein
LIFIENRTIFCPVRIKFCRFQWPRGLRRRSAASCLLRLWVRIPRVVWMFVCCYCCLWSGRRLCDELITRPEESYRMWCVVVCDLETSWMRRPLGGGAVAPETNKQTRIKFYKISFITSIQIYLCDHVGLWVRVSWQIYSYVTLSALHFTFGKGDLISQNWVKNRAIWGVTQTSNLLIFVIETI